MSMAPLHASTDAAQCWAHAIAIRIIRSCMFSAQNNVHASAHTHDSSVNVSSEKHTADSTRKGDTHTANDTSEGSETTTTPRTAVAGALGQLTMVRVLTRMPVVCVLHMRVCACRSVH